MKTIRRIISFLLCIGLLGSIVGFVVKINQIADRDVNSGTDSESEIVNVYTITYRAIENGTETDIYAPLFREDGTYPVKYNEGDTVSISDLYGKDHFFLDPNNNNRELSFMGWYLDKECQTPLDSIAAANLHGDITVYAKISVAIWTKPYKM